MSKDFRTGSGGSGQEALNYGINFFNVVPSTYQSFIIQHFQF